MKKRFQAFAFKCNLDRCTEAAGAGSSAASEFARGFATFDRKAAAAELLRVAREMRFQMPSTEQQVRALV